MTERKQAMESLMELLALEEEQADARLKRIAAELDSYFGTTDGKPESPLVVLGRVREMAKRFP